MNVIVFDGGRLSRYTVPSIQAQGYQPMMIDCAEDETAMARTIAWRLLHADSFVTVEHDIEAPQGSLAWLEHCPDPWCFHAYPINGRSWETICEEGAMGGWFAPLGLTRFRPYELREILRPVLEDPRFTETWVSRDTLVSRALSDAGVTPHRHFPDAIHHHDYGLGPNDSGERFGNRIERFEHVRHLGKVERS